MTKALKREILRVYLSSISWTAVNSPLSLSLTTPFRLSNATVDPINLLSSAILRRDRSRKKRELHVPDGSSSPQLEDRRFSKERESRRNCKRYLPIYRKWERGECNDMATLCAIDSNFIYSFYWFFHLSLLFFLFFIKPRLTKLYRG